VTGDPLPVRRPPAPRTPLATVTHLAVAGDGCDSVPVASVQGTLALDLSGMPGAPPAPELHVLPGEHPEGRREEREHRDVQAWAVRFAQATVEVLGGDRPVTQLLRWTSGVVYSELDRRTRILARTAPAPQRLRRVRPQVRSVHVFRPGPACAEVSVHVRHGHRSRAIAARLERRQDRWQCVALQLG
jgi:uncharacterized protein DUF6459